MKGVDVVIFDIQDVGVRFYTYISTLTYVMEACAENNVELIVLDRPNPHDGYVDGPVLKKKWESFVGMHEVPVVYGLTIGEYGKMVNGEKWLKNGVQARYTLVEMQNYHKKKRYAISDKPSPNLPNNKSINLYPSLCFLKELRFLWEEEQNCLSRFTVLHGREICLTNSLQNQHLVPKILF